MPALSRRYRREIIQSTCQINCKALKNLVFSSFEMSETFLAFMQKNEVSIGSCSSFIDKYKFVINEMDKEHEYFWLVPFIQNLKLYGTPPCRFVQQLFSAGHVKKLDLTYLDSELYKEHNIWNLASIVSEISLNYLMFRYAPQKYYILPWVNDLSISFDLANTDARIDTSLIFIYPSLNVPNLKFIDRSLGFWSSALFATDIITSVTTQLDRTRSFSLSLHNYEIYDNDHIDMIASILRIAPNLDDVDINLTQDTYNSASRFNEFWTEIMKWYRVVELVREHASKPIKISITFWSTMQFGDLTASHLKTIAMTGFNVSRQRRDNSHTVSVTNRETQITPEIEFHLRAMFRLEK